jgi:hypothetical protein
MQHHGKKGFKSPLWLSKDRDPLLVRCSAMARKPSSILAGWRQIK